MTFEIVEKLVECAKNNDLAKLIAICDAITCSRSELDKITKKVLLKIICFNNFDCVKFIRMNIGYLSTKFNKKAFTVAIKYDYNMITALLIFGRGLLENEMDEAMDIANNYNSLKSIKFLTEYSMLLRYTFKPITLAQREAEKSEYLKFINYYEIDVLSDILDNWVNPRPMKFELL